MSGRLGCAALLLAAAGLGAADILAETAWNAPLPTRGDAVLADGQGFFQLAAGGSLAGERAAGLGQLAWGMQTEPPAYGGERNFLYPYGARWTRILVRAGSDPAARHGGGAQVAAGGMAALGYLAYARGEVGASTRRGPWIEVEAGSLLVRVRADADRDGSTVRIGPIWRALDTSNELPRCAGFRLRRKGRLRRPKFLFVRGLSAPGTRLRRSPKQPDGCSRTVVGAPRRRLVARAWRGGGRGRRRAPGGRELLPPSRRRLAGRRGGRGAHRRPQRWRGCPPGRDHRLGLVIAAGIPRIAGSAGGVRLSGA